MKKLVFMAFLLLIPSGLVFASNQNANLDKNGKPSDLQVGITSAERRMIKCGEDGAQLFRNASYETKVSTSQAGRITSTSSVYVASTTMLVTGYEMISMGAETPVDFSGVAGTCYIPASQRIERRYEVPVSSFSFTATLTSGASFYYRIDGVK